jgi:hypothetical protein
MNTSIRTLALTVLVAMTLVGCGNDSTGPEGEAPEAPTLPPASSMQFDFSFFESGDPLAGKSGAESSPEASHLNWINAVVRVAYINLVVADIFAPPVAAFQAAIHTFPVHQSDGSFLWTYTWVDGQHEVVIKLRGRLDGDHVDWALRVTDEQATPPLDDFLWFYGESSLVSESGFWIFNDREGTEPVEVAQIDWSVEPNDDRQLSFENIREGDEEYGDTLTYSVDATIISVDFYDASENLRADITWDELTGAGSLLVPEYNNGERACWDENQEDTICPAD